MVTLALGFVGVVDAQINTEVPPGKLIEVEPEQLLYANFIDTTPSLVIRY
jgi:hypothetical protein